MLDVVHLIRKAKYVPNTRRKVKEYTFLLTLILFMVLIGMFLMLN